MKLKNQLELNYKARFQSLNAIKKGCSTQSIISLASDLLEILCSHREKIYKKQRLQHEKTKVIVFLMSLILRSQPKDPL